MQLMAWVAGLFAFGALVIALYGVRRPAAATELWGVYASTIVIACAYLVPAAVHPALFSLVVAGAAWRCAVELATVYGARIGSVRHGALGAGAAALAAWGASGHPASTIALVIASAALIALTAPLYAQAFTKQPTGARAWVVSTAFPALAAAHLSHLAHMDQGLVWLFILYASVETQDSMAYLFGRVLGRRRILPRLSPNKTVEGAASGALCALVAGSLMLWGLLDLPAGTAFAFAALLVIAGFCGDLFTSALKRAARVKDFPGVHRLHGGVLDIYDSTLFAAIPLSFALWASDFAR